MNIMSRSINTDRIKAIVLDVDGILTDGSLFYPGDASEIKSFHVRDGHGIKLAARAGLKVGILSGRSAEANVRRARELCMDFVYEGEKNKKEAFGKLLREQRLKAAECVYMGDDIVDIPVFKLAGIAVTVRDAPEYLDEFCDIRTKLSGGRGAVRELIDWLLKEQGKWDDIMSRYLD